MCDVITSTTYVPICCQRILIVCCQEQLTCACHVLISKVLCGFEYYSIIHRHIIYADCLQLVSLVLVGSQAGMVTEVYQDLEDYQGS